MRLFRYGVNRHHPDRRFARVINARRSLARRVRDRLHLAGRWCGKVQAGELQQAEFSRSADRRAAVLNAELAVHGTLVGLHGVERDV